MSTSATEQRSQERQSLLSKLLDSVKQCQIRFGGRTELATENDSRVICLCTQFENVLQHGIRKSIKGLQRLKPVTEVMKGLNLINNDSDSVFWHLVKTILNKHELERYMLLKNIHTDIGRGRAWLRSALNERSLERYIHMLLSDTNQIRQYYEDWAFLMDQERNSMLPMMAAGLGSILFAINIDNSDLNKASSTEPSTESIKNVPVPKNTLEPQPLVAQTMVNGAGKRSKKKKKWPTTQIVSFDDNEMCQSTIGSPGSECYSAPATCLSSPVSTVANFLDLSPTKSQPDVAALPCDTSTVPKSDNINIPFDGNTSPLVSVQRVEIASYTEERRTDDSDADGFDVASEYRRVMSLPGDIGTGDQLSTDSSERKTPLATSSTSSGVSLNVAENW